MWLYFVLDTHEPNTLAPQLANYMRRFVQRGVDGQNQPDTLISHPVYVTPALQDAARRLGLTLRHDPKLRIGTLGLGNPRRE